MYKKGMEKGIFECYQAYVKNNYNITEVMLKVTNDFVDKFIDSQKEYAAKHDIAREIVGLSQSILYDVFGKTVKKNELTKFLRDEIDSIEGKLGDFVHEFTGHPKVVFEQVIDWTCDSIMEASLNPDL